MKSVLVLALVFINSLLALPQERYVNQFGNLDLERTYAEPTLVSIGTFTAIPGQHPKIEVRIEHRRTIYTCSIRNEAEYRRERYRIGEKVQIKIQGHFLLLRRSGKNRWMKLNLIGTDEVANL